MADKNTQLSITISTVDKATAKIRAIGERLDRVTKPTRDLGNALSDLRSKSGLDNVINGLTGVGGAVGDVLGKVALIGGAIAAATAGMFHLIDEFEELGDKAESLGVPIDTLAQLRYAAEQSGSSAEALDRAFENLSRNMGEMRANAGPLVEFIGGRVSPVLLQQLKATKSNEEAFGLLANAMAKLKDPAKRAALAGKVFGDSKIAALLAKGSKGIAELRAEHLKSAGSMEKAAAAASAASAAKKRLKAATDGVKAALVSGLSPALEKIMEKIRAWVETNREAIGAWAADLGKRLPDAFESLVAAIEDAIDFLTPFFDSSTKIKIALGVLAAVIAGPLISAIVNLGIALLTTPVGWILAGVAALAAAWYLVITRWDEVAAFWSGFWDSLTEKLGVGVVAIKLMLTPIIGAAALFIGAWGRVKDFFVAMWDGVTSVFQKAWEIIKPIVEKVVAAADAVKGVIGALTDDVGSKVNAEVEASKARVQGAVDRIKGNVLGRTSTEAKVTIDIANAPRGTRVTADPQSTADVDLSVGYQLIPGML